MKRILFFFFLNLILIKGNGQTNDCTRSTQLISKDDIEKCSDTYTLEFEDNFDGDHLDTIHNWQLQGFSQGELSEANNSKQGYYTYDNVKVSDGICQIAVKHETVQRKAVSWKPATDTLSDGNPNLRTFYYTSSCLWSLYQYGYGKYEIRCKMPSGKGLWPTYWMFGGGVWNEINVFDNAGSTDYLETGVGHGNRPTHHGCPKGIYGYDLANWHAYTCIYTPMKVSWYIDDDLQTPIREVYRYTVSGDPLPCGKEYSSDVWVEELLAYPREDMNIVFSMQVCSGNGSTEAPDETTPFPAIFYVDYIRYSRLDAPPPPPVDVLPNPNNGFFTLRFNSKSQNEKHLVVYDCLEYAVAENIFTADLLDADFSFLKRGIYFIKVWEGEKVYSQKLVIM